MLRNVWNQNDSEPTLRYELVAGHRLQRCNRSLHVTERAKLYSLNGPSRPGYAHSPSTAVWLTAEFTKVSRDQQTLKIFRHRRFEHQAFACDGMDERRPPRVQRLT
jgi:hypothetical protein